MIVPAAALAQAAGAVDDRLVAVDEDAMDRRRKNFVIQISLVNQFPNALPAANGARVRGVAPRGRQEKDNVRRKKREQRVDISGRPPFVYRLYSRPDLGPIKLSRRQRLKQGLKITVFTFGDHAHSPMFC
jgi:hypothetical protein